MKLSKIFTLIASVLVLFAASRLCVPLQHTLAAEENGWRSYTGRVIAIQDTIVTYYDTTGGETAEEDTNTTANGSSSSDLKKTAIVFSVKLSSGELKGKTVTAVQVLDDFIALKSEPVQPKDSVIILHLTGTISAQKSNAELADNPDFVFEEYHRMPALASLAALFIILILVLGGLKGFYTLFSLGVTCASIFFVFIPAIFSGYNLYTTSICICLYITLATILILNGYNKKSYAAIAGCMGGVAAAALFSVCMMKILRLNGYLNNDSLYLVSLLPGGKTDLLAVIFSAIIIGAVGAVMDVAMSLSSALYELAQSVPDIRFKQLVKSGFAIGKDMMGTMANTLILAYIGSSLSFLLVLIAYNSSFLGIINHQMISVELLQALCGSLGILLCIPLTVLIASLLYSVKIVITVEPTKSK